MITQAPRQCPTCGPVAWRKVRPAGARASRFECLACGRPTRRIKGRRKATTMPAALYSHRELEKACDRLWSEIVHAKAPDGRCKGCGLVRPLQAAHGWHRTKKPTRHDPANGLPLCAGCHMRIEHDAEATRDLFVRYIGDAEWERLTLAVRCGGKRDLTLVRLYLESLLPKRAVSPLEAA